MSILRNVLICIFLISFITFVALFGQLPALRRTPIGWTQRLLCVYLPNGAKRVDRLMTGGRITVQSKSLAHYLFYEPNPIVLILFLSILTGSALFFLFNAWPTLPTCSQLSIPLIVVQPYLWTYLCVISTSHHITPANHETRMRDYPYDHILFRPSKLCSTCHFPKPARSKHCSLCGVCVAMSDHHCPWINNCVGRGNYRYFLALLLSIGIMEIYGVFLSWWILEPYLHLTPSEWVLQQTGRAALSVPLSSWSAWWQAVLLMLVTAVNAGGLSIAGVGLLALFTFPLPLGLLAYHCYLIWAGMTTNESQKWAEWRDDMADGVVFQTSRKALTAYHEGRMKAAATTGSTATPSVLLAARDEDEPLVRWPCTSDLVLVQTTDGRPPNGQEALWSRVWSLAEIQNIYDLGGWENFVAIMKGR